jgi:hypothetical protein
MRPGDVMQAAKALRAAGGGGDGLEDPSVGDCLARLFPADQINLCDLDLVRSRGRLVGLVSA